MPNLQIVVNAVSLALLWRHRRRVIGSTLAAVWVWHAIVVFILLMAGGLATTAPDALRPGSPWNYVIAVGLFCPTMALLGAKRPQDRGWAFVVVTLWGVLALPAFEVALLREGEKLWIRDMRGAFLWALIAVEVLNRAGTRRWFVGLLQSAAQVLLLAEHLPGLRMSAGCYAGMGASLCWMLAIAGTVRGVAPRARSDDTLDALWLAFRDCFGVLWALRVQQRINAVCAANTWPVWLGWTGFQQTNEADVAANTGDWQVALRQTMMNLLRRFMNVDPQPTTLSQSPN